jgi:signal transduction histidine kinase
MFNLLEDHNEALKYYLIAHDNSIKLNHPLMTAMIASNLGSLYIKTGELKKAAEYLTKSIFDFKNLNNKQWLAFSYTTMGELYIQSKEYNNALDYYKLAMNEHNSVNDIKGKADLFYGLSRAYFGINDLEKAEKNVLESQKLYSSFKLDSGLEKVYRVLYEIKKQQKEIEKSLEYLEEVEKLSNDNFKRKNKVNLNMLNVKLQFEKETEHLKAKNKLALDKQRKYLKWSLAAFITSLLIVLIVLNANKREKLLIKKLENNAVVLNESQKALIAINNNQDKLFSIVGHDLRGPIISFNELLKLYIEDPKGKEYFEKFAPQIKSDLDYLQLTTDNLLYWGKTQMKGNLSKAEHILVKKEIDLILQLYRNELNKKTIEVDCQIKKTDFVTIDINQFNVIFRNILSNAIKFTPNGGKITLSTTLKDTTLVIKVSDTGVGMSQETVNKLFNNEAHISTKGTNFEKGTGLGLRLVKELINNNNGSIVVQSQLNIGSNFIIELPHLLV